MSESVIDIPFDASAITPVVRIDNYLGPWAVSPERFRQVAGAIRGMNLQQHVSDNVAAGYRTAEPLADLNTIEAEGGSIAIINVHGTLTKQGSSYDDSSSLVALKKQVRTAARDASITGILMVIDSPGGTVAGTKDLSDEIWKARQDKPVYAVIEDLGASAAYWIAAQCDRVYAANATTMTGSIGTFCVLYDLSEFMKKEGVRTILVKAGTHKGMGTPGTEITDENVAEVQKQIDLLQEQFTSDVARGRGKSIEEIQKLVTGLVYLPDEAESLGLIDGIRSVEETLQELQQGSSGNSQSPTRGSAMAKPAASFNEIVAACPGIDETSAEDSMFIVACQKRGLSAAEANAEWCKTLKSRVEAARSEEDEEQAEEEEEKARKARSRKAKSRKAKSRRAEEDEEDYVEDDEEQSEDDEDEYAENDEEDQAEDEDDEPSSRSRYRSRYRRRGVRAIGTRRVGKRSSAGDLNSQWNALVNKFVARGLSRPEATRRAYATNPELAQALKEEANARRRR